MHQFLRNLIIQFSRAILWLSKQEGTPGQRARGLAAGVFSGCFPLFGLQTIFGIAIASLVRGNRFLAATGTWISNPITYLPIYWINYQVGSALLGNDVGIEVLSSLTIKKVYSQGWFFGIRLIVGSTLVGLISGGLLGFLAYIFLRGLPRRRNSSEL